ncbi:MAG: thiamine-binding protein [Candidatus Bathyarchaeia archaeon]
METILEAVKAAHEALYTEGILRIESILRVDDRRDKFRTMKDKVEAVKRYMRQY